MKRIIDIPEDLYKEKIRGTTSNRQDRKILECVKNATPLETEFEEIKQEITNIQIENCTIPKTAKDIQYEALWILDNHISELKGENNG